MLTINIRKATPLELPAIMDLVNQAFRDMPESDQTEDKLVQRIAQSENFLPSLSLVAVHKTRLIGYILLSKIKIDWSYELHDSLALAPLAVLPEFQSQGVGTQLVKYAHALAKKQNHKSILVVGNPEYYHRFGYMPCLDYGIALPFDIPEKYCMAKELTPGALDFGHGMANYPNTFYG